MHTIASSTLAFVAGCIMVLTLTGGTTAPEPAPESVPCSPAHEDAYEIMRFASYSHTYWLDWLDETGEAVDPYAMDYEWHTWWADNYALVMRQMRQECDIADSHPVLPTLPGTWESYPARSQQ